MTKASSRTPDWEVWGGIRVVELWEAVALALGIDPQHVSRPFNSPPSVFEFDEPEPFQKRLFQASRSVGTTRGIKPAGPLAQNPRGQKVELSEFCQWATSIGWKVPEPLLALSPRGNYAVDLLPKERANLYRLIGALSQTLLDSRARPASFSNHVDLINFLDRRYKGYPGISKRHLGDVLPEALEMLKLSP